MAATTNCFYFFKVLLLIVPLWGLCYLFVENGVVPSGRDHHRAEVTAAKQKADALLLKNRRANATILIVARNEDLAKLRETLLSFEHSFNSRFNYPYVFLNNEPFSDDFKTEITDLLLFKFNNSHQSPPTRNVSFGLIPREHWSYPEWIDLDKAAEYRQRMINQHQSKTKGDDESYHHFLRFYAGFFYRHPLLQEFDYYWRVEPHITFPCRVDYDPFLLMTDRGVEYGFLPMLMEDLRTMATIWQTTKSYLREVYPELDAPKLGSPVLNLFLDDRHENIGRGKYFKQLRQALRAASNSSSSSLILPEIKFTWNRCHFWSNFEIASLNFFRSPFYQSFFDFLDKAGGFYYERWSDAVVHSLAVGIFLDANQIHYFSDIGLKNEMATWCPLDETIMATKCTCYNRSKANFNLAQPDVRDDNMCQINFLEALGKVQKNC